MNNPLKTAAVALISFAVGLAAARLPGLSVPRDSDPCPSGTEPSDGDGKRPERQDRQQRQMAALEQENARLHQENLRLAAAAGLLERTTRDPNEPVVREGDAPFGAPLTPERRARRRSRTFCSAR